MPIDGVKDRESLKPSFCSLSTARVLIVFFFNVNGLLQLVVKKSYEVKEQATQKVSAKKLHQAWPGSSKGL